MKRKSTVTKKPLRSSQVPATSGMLKEMEARLNHRMDSKFHKQDAKFAKMDARFAKMDARFAKMDGRFGTMDARFAKIDSQFVELRAEMNARFAHVDSQFSSMKADISDIKSELHRVALLVEEQNARNRYVMDGYAQIYDLLVQGKIKTSIEI